MFDSASPKKQAKSIQKTEEANKEETLHQDIPFNKMIHIFNFTDE